MSDASGLSESEWADVRQAADDLARVSWCSPEYATRALLDALNAFGHRERNER